ncbi:MAG: molybdopterin-guanine dinucleotide biosynthesis protein B [Thermodesulfobacteriota bacterium]
MDWFKGAGVGVDRFSTPRQWRKFIERLSDMTAIVAVVGGGNTGKTTVIENLIPVLQRRGYRVGTVKHVAHSFALDPSGKDSFRHRAAGAETVVVDANDEMVMFKALAPRTDSDRLVNDILSYFTDVDIVLAEGYKGVGVPKIEVFGGEGETQPICAGDANLLAVVTDRRINAVVPQLATDDAAGIADVIERLIR